MSARFNPVRKHWPVQDWPGRRPTHGRCRRCGKLRVQWFRANIHDETKTLPETLVLPDGSTRAVCWHCVQGLEQHKDGMRPFTVGSKVRVRGTAGGRGKERPSLLGKTLIVARIEGDEVVTADGSRWHSATLGGWLVSSGAQGVDWLWISEAAK